MTRPRSILPVTATLLLVVVVCGALIAAAFTLRPHTTPRIFARETPIQMPTNAVSQTVAWVGDSYTVGAGSASFNHHFATLVSAYEGWSFQNFANGGTGYLAAAKENALVACDKSFCPNYAGEIPAIASFNPTIIIVTGGRNDVSLNSTRVREAVQTFYDELRAACPKARIYAVSPVWDDRDPPASLARIGQSVEQAVEGVEGTYLDIEQPLRGHTDLISSDGVHPNDDGHAAIAKAVEVALSTVDG